MFGLTYFKKKKKIFCYEQLSKRPDAKNLTKKLVDKGRDILIKIIKNPQIKNLLKVSTKLIGELQTNEEVLNLLKSNLE